jgi:hypothetical protein
MMIVEEQPSAVEPKPRYQTLAHREHAKRVSKKLAEKLLTKDERSLVD